MFYLHVCIYADVKSDNAKSMQARVLERVHTEIELQTCAVAEVLREMEDEFMHNLDAQQQVELSAKWARARKHWDEDLAVLDRVAMTGCHKTSEKSNTARVAEAFVGLDCNADGVLSLDEFSPFAKALGVPDEA